MLPAFLIGFSTILIVSRSVPEHPSDHIDGKRSFRLLTLNVGQLSNDTSVAQAVLRGVRSLNVDVVCFQEFGLYYKWPDTESVAKDYSERLDMPYHDFTPHPGNIFGTACFSRYPILSVDSVFQRLSETNEAKYYRLLIDGDTLHLINLHAQSYNLFNEKESAPWSSRVSDALKRRRLQADRVVELEADVVVGDLNASIGSYPHSALHERFLDVQLEAGFGLTPTHNWVPTRLDYIWIRKSMHFSDFQLIKSFPSDHHALVSTITW